MSWLNAHEAYIIERITRDREDALSVAIDVATDTEPTGIPSDAVRESRPKAAAVFCPHALAKASR